jgi:hypothetical protein
MTSTTASSFNVDRRSWLNELALLYVFAGYTAGLFCITSPLWYLNAIGVLLIVHTLTWAAYFVTNLFTPRSFDSTS